MDNKDLVLAKSALLRVEEQVDDLGERLERFAITISAAEFDPSTGAPTNLAGQWMSNISLVIDELGELSEMVRRLLKKEKGPPGPPSSSRQLRPRPLTWDPEPEGIGVKLMDPAGNWHARVWVEGVSWCWELAPGYQYGDAQTIVDPALDGEKVASESCERVLALHGWPRVCLPSGVAPPGTFFV